MTDRTENGSENRVKTEAKHVGEILKASRLAKKLTLEEVGSATSIRINYLEAIEEGQVGQFIANIYAMGFIKQYAAFLGLNVEQLMRESPRMFLPKEQKHEFDYGIGTLEYRNTMGGGSRFLPNLLWTAFASALLAGLWFLAKQIGIF